MFGDGIDGVFFTEGFTDYHQGLSRDAIPGQFVGEAKHSWLAGWDYAAATHCRLNRKSATDDTSHPQ